MKNDKQLIELLTNMHTLSKEFLEKYKAKDDHIMYALDQIPEDECEAVLFHLEKFVEYEVENMTHNSMLHAHIFTIEIYINGLCGDIFIPLDQDSSIVNKLIHAVMEVSMHLVNYESGNKYLIKERGEYADAITRISHLITGETRDKKSKEDVLEIATLTRLAPYIFNKELEQWKPIDILNMYGNELAKALKEM